MRTLVGALAIVALLSAREAHADEGRGNIVFFNPFTLIVRTVTVGVEHQTAPKATVVVGATYTNDLEVETSGEDFVVEGWGAYLQPHLYVGRRDAPRGPYLAPFASIQRSHLAWELSPDETVTTFGAGATVGWSWMIGGRLNFKLGIGGRYYLTESRRESELAGSSYDGLGLTGDFKLGWRF